MIYKNSQKFVKGIAAYTVDYTDWVTGSITYNLERIGVKTRDEKGALSIELTITIALLVGIAIAVGVVLFSRAQDAANSVPTVPSVSTRIP